MGGARRLRVAVVGAGVSGIAAAHYLAPDCDVQLFEGGPRIGGHARTIDLDLDGGLVAVDTGFIVFNNRTYPHFCRMLDDLGLSGAPSSMSFAVRHWSPAGYLEWASCGLRGWFGQGRWGDARHWRLGLEVARFFRRARRALGAGEVPGTLGRWLESQGFSRHLRDMFVLPMGAAIWSTPVARMEAMPAHFFLQFFRNHGLLGFTGQPRWMTLAGGSRSYLRRFAESFRGAIHCNTGIERLDGGPGGTLELVDAGGVRRAFDRVILACHSGQSADLVRHSHPAASRLLGRMRHRDNLAVVHSDRSLMPHSRRCWASWVCCHHADDKDAPLSVSYWMNNLQPLATDRDIFVSLNPREGAIDPALIYDRHVFSHPCYDEDSLRVQRAVRDLQGRGGLYFAGAWLGNGFHEDGVASAINAVARLRADAL